MSEITALWEWMPSWILTALNFGQTYPDGDEAALFELGDAWLHAADQLTELIPDLKAVTDATQKFYTGDGAVAVGKEFATLFSGQYSIEELADALKDLGRYSRSGGTELEYTKIMMATFAGITVYAVYQLLAAWPWGSSLVPLALTAGRQTLNVAAREGVRRLALESGKITLKNLIRQYGKQIVIGALKLGAAGGGIDLGIQGYQVAVGHRDGGIDPMQTARMAVEWGAGALVGAPVGIAASRGLARTALSPALRGTLAGVAGGAAGAVGTYGAGIGWQVGAQLAGGSLDLSAVDTTFHLQLLAGGVGLGAVAGLRGGLRAGQGAGARPNADGPAASRVSGTPRPDPVTPQSRAEGRDLYRDLSRQAHPDRFPAGPERAHATEFMQRVNDVNREANGPGRNNEFSERHVATLKELRQEWAERPAPADGTAAHPESAARTDAPARAGAADTGVRPAGAEGGSRADGAGRPDAAARGGVDAGPRTTAAEGGTRASAGEAGPARPHGDSGARPTAEGGPRTGGERPGSGTVDRGAGAAGERGAGAAERGAGAAGERGGGAAAERGAGTAGERGAGAAGERGAGAAGERGGGAAAERGAGGDRGAAAERGAGGDRGAGAGERGGPRSGTDLGRSTPADRQAGSRPGVGAEGTRPGGGRPGDGAPSVAAERGGRQAQERFAEPPRGRSVDAPAREVAPGARGTGVEAPTRGQGAEVAGGRAGVREFTSRGPMADEFAAAPVELRAPETGAGGARPAKDGPNNCAVYGLWFGREVLGLDGVLPIHGDGKAIKAIGFGPQDIARAAGGNWQRGGFASVDEVAATVRDNGGPVLALVEYQGFYQRKVGAHQLTFFSRPDRPGVVLVREWNGTHALEYEHVWGQEHADVAGVYGIVFGENGRPVDPLAPGEAPRGRAGVEHSFTRAGRRPFEPVDQVELTVGAEGRPGEAPVEGERVREASVARDWVVDQLRGHGWRDEGVLADARVVTSELVANSLRHSSGAVRVIVVVGEREGTRVARVEVIDNSPVIVAPVGSDELPDDFVDALDPEQLDALIQGLGERGRGMGMVADLTDDTGVDELPEGKSTWFELSEPAPPPGQVPDTSVVDVPAQLEILTEGAPAQIVDWLRTEHGLEVEGFDAPGVHPEVVREFAAAVHDMLTRYPQIDLPRIRIAELDNPGTFAELRADPAGRVQWLGLGTRYAGDPASLGAVLADAVTSGRMAPGHLDRPLYGRIVHELGHALDYAGGGVARERAMTALTEYYRATYPGQRGGFADWLRGLAGYSFKGAGGAFVAHEAVAEAFADVEVLGAHAGEQARVLHQLLVVHAEAAAERARRAARGDGTTEYRYPAQGARSHLEGGVPKICVLEALRYAREELGIETIAPQIHGARDIALHGVSAAELSEAAGGGWHPGGFRSLDEAAQKVRQTGGVVIGVVEFLGLNRPDVVGAHAFVMFRAESGAVIVHEELNGAREFVYSWGENPPRVAGVYGIVYDADGVPEHHPNADDQAAPADRPTARIGAGPQEPPGEDPRQAALANQRSVQQARFERLRHGLLDALVATEKVSRTGPEGRALTGATPAELREALASLSPDKRRILVLRFWEGRSPEEVASALHRPPEMTQAIQRGAVRDMSRFLVGKLGEDLTPNEAKVVAALRDDPARVHRAIEQLPRAARQYVELRLIRELPAADIPAAMDRSPAQVGTLKSRAFRTLAELLSGDRAAPTGTTGAGGAALTVENAVRDTPDRIRALLAELSPSERAFVDLTYLRGLAPEVVAEQLGSSPGALKAVKSRATRKLAELLSAGQTTTARQAWEAIHRARESDPEQLRAALAQLTDAQRAAVRAQLDGRDIDSVAAELGRTVAAVKGQQRSGALRVAEILAGARPEAPSPAVDQVRTALRDRPDEVRRAIDLLTPDHRQVLELTVLQAHPLDRVAERMGRTEGAVGALQRRAARGLLDVLESGAPARPSGKPAAAPAAAAPRTAASETVRRAQQEDPAAFRAAVARLPRHQREVVEHRLLSGWTAARTAAAMGRTEYAVRRLQERAVHALAGILAGGEPPRGQGGEALELVRTTHRDNPAALRAALRELTPDQARVVRLRVIQERSIADTASAMRRSEDSVTALFRAATRRLADLVTGTERLDSAGATAYLRTVRRDHPEVLRDAIALLPEPERTFAVLRFVRDKKMISIASTMALSPSGLGSLRIRTIDRLVELLTAALGAPPPSAPPSTARGELSDMLRTVLRDRPDAARRAIGRLPEIDGQVLDLRFLQGKTLAETAAELGRSGDAVSAVQRRALRRLPELLAEEVSRPAPQPSPVDSGAPALHTIGWIEAMRRTDPQALLRAIDLLSPDQARMARQRFLHGASIDDIAAAAVRPRAWIQDLQRRTVRTLRELLADELPVDLPSDTEAAPGNSAEVDGVVLFEGDLPADGDPLYRGVPRLLADGSPNPAYADARAGRATPRGSRTVSAEEHVLGAHQESDLTSWSRSRAMAEGFAGGDGVVLEWRTGLPPEGAAWAFKPFLDYDLMMQYRQVLIQGTLTGARATRYLAEDAGSAERGRDESRARGVPRPASADWDLSGYRTAAAVGVALAAEHDIAVTGFDLPGVDLDTAREFARAVHDVLRAYRWIDLREVRIGEIAQDPPPTTELEVQPAETLRATEAGEWYTAAIVFNVRYATRPQLFASMWAEAIAEGHMAGVADRPVYGVITHELGHAVDSAGHYGAREEYFYELFHRFRITHRSTDMAEFTDWVAGQLTAYSRYSDGTVDPVEALAEAFAAVRQSGASATEAQWALHDLLIAQAEAVDRRRSGGVPALTDAMSSPPGSASPAPGKAPSPPEPVAARPLSTWDPAAHATAADVGATLARRHPRLTVLGFDGPGIGLDVALEYARAVDELLSAFPQAPLREVRITELDDELYAEADYGIRADGARDAGITVNATYAADPARFQELWSDEVDSGRRAGPSDPVYANVVHEFGHILDAFAGHRTRGRAEQELFRHYAASRDQVDAEGFQEWLRTQFGAYVFDRGGRFAAKEAVAEAFAAARHLGRRATDGQRALHRLLLGDVDAAMRESRTTAAPERGSDESRRGGRNGANDRPADPVSAGIDVRTGDAVAGAEPAGPDPEQHPDPVRLPAPRATIADWEDDGLHEFRPLLDAEARRLITEQGGRVLRPGNGIVDGPSPRVIVTEWLGSDIDTTLTEVLDAHPEAAEALASSGGTVEYLSASVNSAGEVTVQPIEPPEIRRAVLASGPWAGTAMTYWQDREGYWRPVPRDVPPDRIPAARSAAGPPATVEMGADYRGEDSADRPLFQRVHYLTPEQREAARVFIGPDGRLYRAADGTAFHSYRSEAGRRTEFVMDGFGNLYADRSRIDRRLMHSSFLAGENVAAAGMIEVHAGRVLFLDNRSGHYQPQMPRNIAALRWLVGQGLGLAHGFELLDYSGQAWQLEPSEEVSGADPAAAFSAERGVRVSGFDTDGLTVETAREYLGAVDRVLAAHPWVTLDRVRIAPLPPGIIARADPLDAGAGPMSITFNEQYAIDPDLLASEWENSGSGAAIVGELDRPISGAVTYEMGKVVDHAGDHSAQRLAMRTLYEHFVTETGTSDLTGFNRWLKSQFSYDSFGSHGSFAVDRALAESFVAADNPESASAGHKLLARLLSRQADPGERLDVGVVSARELPGDPGFGDEGIRDAWTGHATVAEVAAALSAEHGLAVQGFDLPGVEPAVAREFARAITELLGEHPEADLRGVAVEPLERAVFGRTLMVPAGAGWFTRSILLNERYVTDPLLFQHDWAAAVDSGFVRGPRDRPVYGVLVHEFGHALDAAGGFTARTKASLVIAMHFHEIGGSVEQLADWLPTVLTRYSLSRDGTLDPAEALPEAFAAVRHDPAVATPAQRLLAELLLRAARDGGGAGGGPAAPAGEPSPDFLRLFDEPAHRP